jgi:hypothetical protein
LSWRQVVEERRREVVGRLVVEQECAFRARVVVLDTGLGRLLRCAAASIPI